MSLKYALHVLNKACYSVAQMVYTYVVGKSGMNQNQLAEARPNH